MAKRTKPDGQTETPAQEPASAGKRGAKPPEPSGYNGPSANVVAQALADWTALQAEAARISQRKSTLIKNFEKQGGEGSALKRLFALSNLDPAEARAAILRDYRYAAFTGVIPAGDAQGTFAQVLEESQPVAGEAAQQLAGARAYTDGYNTGKAGGALGDNKFAARPGSIEFVQWRNGFDDGHDDWLSADPSRRERELDQARAEEAQDAEREPAEEVAPPA